MPLILRIVRAGAVAAIVAGAAGFAVERVRFGASDQTALARVQAEIGDRFERSASGLAAIAARTAAQPEIPLDGPPDQTRIRRLFDVAQAAVPGNDTQTGVTIYDSAAAPLAWAGRVSDLPKERVQGPGALLIAPSALGPRLIRVQPVAKNGLRPATVVAEQSLGLTEQAPGPVDTFLMQTSVAPVTLRIAAGAAAADSAYRWVVSAPDSTFLVEAEVSPGDLSAARARWRAVVRAVLLGIAAATLLLCTGPVFDMRRGAADTSRFLALTSAVVVMVVIVRVILYVALAPFASTSDPTPLELLLTTITMAAVVWVVLDLVERRRTARPRLPLLAPAPDTMVVVATAYAAAAATAALLIWAYELLLRRLVAETTIDLLHFSLHPLSAGRISIEFALALLHASVIWAAVAVLRLPAARWRLPGTAGVRGAAVLGWLAGSVAGTLVAGAVWRTSGVPLGPLWVALVAAGAAAVAFAHLGHRMRRMSQTTRLAIFFVALLGPAVAMYPSLLAHATAAKERLVSDQFGPEAASLREDLQRRLQRTVEQIDAIPSLADFLTPAGSDARTDPATIVWSRTDLAAYRLTSAIELYDAGGQLVSRFALSLPEYSTTTNQASHCTWEEPFEEVSPFGSSERHVLRTMRGICAGGRIVGSIVVRVMLDYRTLPFISSQSPYLESLRPGHQPPPEGVSGRDVEFAVYGWTRAPIFESGTRVWRLDDAIFQRLVDSREPFWADVDRDGETFRVYFLSDRGGIYALGYPVIDVAGHLINLAELVLLVAVLYITSRIALWIAGLLTRRPPAGGRALLREVRSSFYRKLFLAFWGGAVAPVFILAIFTRTYVQTQLNTTAEDAAARTVTTAQRLVEDYAALQQRGAAALDTIDDQIMVLVRRAIDEDVNLFNRARLQATSARDLFASQLFSLRTPADVYRSILLDRLPTYVREEVVGTFHYSVAAAPVRSSGREGIVTVPLTNRQQQIEQQIDELDRLVLSGFVLFSLLGAALGYWMAEQIADPVNRLTRATRRIARGDLDARIAATSSDELRRLVEDFNQMAADLKRQRIELERTQRLEAWADMARQVAHDIKNPLTPIQLSAEHAQRVNNDRGRPLSPVLDECVNAILKQVRLLRQISAEFSSFASSPTPRPEITDVAALIDEVVAPYRAGLAQRVRIDVQEPADLPRARIDRTLFARALTNIIENALHAMPGGGTLTIVARAAADRIAVEITDTGVGMDQEALAKIFEPYFSTKATGTGLGLTIAKRNVELIGGGIEVRSERGVGTTVTMTLPVA